MSGQLSQVATLNTLDWVSCFQTKTVNAALKAWMAEQIRAFPDKTQTIEVTAAAMRDFLTSSHVLNHGLVVKQLLDEATMNAAMKANSGD